MSISDPAIRLTTKAGGRYDRAVDPLAEEVAGALERSLQLNALAVHRIHYRIPVAQSRALGKRGFNGIEFLLR